MQRFGEAIVPGKQYRRRPGAYAVLWRGGKVLVTHQDAPVPEYQLPGGGIEKGESALQALHREAFEETGWSLGAVRRIGAYRRFTWMPEYELWAEKICHVFLARPILRFGPPLEEGHRAVWAEPGEALGLLTNEGDRFYLARALEGLPY